MTAMNPGVRIISGDLPMESNQERSLGPKHEVKQQALDDGNAKRHPFRIGREI
jgi:hypothetical protein